MNDTRNISSESGSTHLRIMVLLEGLGCIIIFFSLSDIGNISKLQIAIIITFGQLWAMWFCHNIFIP